MKTFHTTSLDMHRFFVPIYIYLNPTWKRQKYFNECTCNDNYYKVNNAEVNEMQILFRLPANFLSN